MSATTPAALRPAVPTPHPLAGLADTLSLPIEPGAAAVAVTGVTQASAETRPGDLYVARPGAHSHGARYAAAAVAAGAVAVLTDPDGADLLRHLGPPVLVVRDPRAVLGAVSCWVYDDPSESVALFGVTGTQGKTTTTHFLRAGLQAAGEVAGLIGTSGVRIGDEWLESARTTPEAPALQATLALMRERGVTAAAMEVSSHALVLGRVEGTRFAVGGFTNLAQDHLDFHRDMADYFEAKARLFDGRSRREVVNADDDWGRRLVGGHTITTSAQGRQDASWRAVEIAASGYGVSFGAVARSGRRIDVRLALPGAHNVANALLSIGMLDAAGIDLDRAVPALAAVTVPGRLERIEAGQPFGVYVDYAHKPGAIAAVLRALRPATSGSLIVVLGAGGDRDAGKRPVMGAAAAAGADVVVVTDDNPRSEDPKAIRAQVLAGARSGAGAAALVLEIGSRRDAIAAAVDRARPGDTVLIAGKGDEQGQETHGQVLPFDDRVVARQLLGPSAATA